MLPKLWEFETNIGIVHWYCLKAPDSNINFSQTVDFYRVNFVTTDQEPRVHIDDWYCKVL